MRGSLRLFVAVYPPRDVAQSLLDELKQQRLPAHRAVPAEQVHLTLQFIGDTALRELQNVEESVERSCSGIEPFPLRVVRLAPLPECGAARLIAAWADVDSSLTEIHKRLVARLARNLRARDSFVPHFTLCRFLSPAPGAVDCAITPIEMQVKSISLMSSKLTLSGAVHVRLREYSL